ncbi:MAG: SDR family NAD(P)-dependent oxidoreductase, partial [Myxococcales bacterium]|nr:SDR family NAD(P)-dependent oxidoreductase [Myxococcales bacterium]
MTDGRRLEGRSAIVTAAGSGIGRATALAFAREGARLALNDVDAERLEAVAAEARDAGAEVATLA